MVGLFANLLFLIGPPRLVQHQRSRSAHAAIVYQPKCEDDLLKPLPLRGPVISQPRASFYDPVRSGNHSEIYALHNDPSADSAAGMVRSTYDAMGPAYAQRASKMAPAMMGNYAQIDPQTAIYQRRSSSSSSVTSSIGSKDTFDAILASPASSTTSFESWQSTSRKPDHGWQRPAPIKQYRRRRDEGELFAALPEEVLSLILQRLKESHLKPGSASCTTCMMRDLCAVAVSAKKLLKVARVALYVFLRLQADV